MMFRVGDIYALAPIFATLYAIVSKAQTYSFVNHNSTEEEEKKSENPNHSVDSFSRDMVDT